MSELTGWWPTRIRADGDGAIVTWRQLGATPLAHPFFEETVGRALEATDPPVLETSLDESLEALDALPALEPAGFVFHMSRAGSTLVGRMLAADPANRVVAEAATLSYLLSPPLAHVDEERRRRWVTGLLRSLGQGTPGQRRLLVKFKPRDVLSIRLVRQAFPAVPWVFLHRHPLEVLVSLRRRPSTWLTCRHCSHPIEGVDDALPREVFAARMLAAFCDAARTNLDDRALVVDYRDVTGDLRDILVHLGLPADAATIDRMIAVTGDHAKRPGQPFVPDSVAKRRMASEAARAASARFAEPAQARLVAAALERAAA